MNNEQVMERIASIIEAIDLVGKRQYLYNCWITTDSNGKIRIYITEWYEDIIRKNGVEMGLDNMFDIDNGTNGIYQSLESFSISGFKTLFFSSLNSILNQYGYKKKGNRYEKIFINS